MPAEIDPELAHLLPPDQRGSAPGPTTGAQTALFNARTGRFTPADYAYTVDHLDEFNRSKRMASHYFDYEAWEKQRAEENAKKRRDEEAGIAPAKITKKDMVGLTQVSMLLWLMVRRSGLKGKLRRRSREVELGYAIRAFVARRRACIIIGLSSPLASIVKV
jgi:hypothetical protein